MGRNDATFREMTGADLPDGLRLSRASGWNQTTGDWRLMLALNPGLFRVGIEEGRVVASGGAVRYGRELAWICMILVDPACRGRGLGTCVFDEVLARLVDEPGGPEAIGLDATPEGRGIYAQRGFVDGPTLVRMRRDASASPARDGGEATRPMQRADLDAVLALDRPVFGADRTAVLQDALRRAPRLARVALDGRGRVRGYCLGRPGDHSDHVGPVVADERALGSALVASALVACGSRPVVVDARAEAPGWTASLEALGFHAQRPFTRMYLGAVRPPGTPALELAIRGPEMG